MSARILLLLSENVFESSVCRRRYNFGLAVSIHDIPRTRMHRIQEVNQTSCSLPMILCLRHVDLVDRPVQFAELHNVRRYCNSLKYLCLDAVFPTGVAKALTTMTLSFERSVFFLNECESSLNSLRTHKQKHHIISIDSKKN